MCSEARSPLLSIRMHPSAVFRENGPIDDECWRSQCLERLAYELLRKGILA